MKKRSVLLVLAAAALVPQGYSRQDQVVCGTHREKSREELHLHRQAVRMARPKPEFQRLSAAPAAKDAGNIAILDDSDGVVSRRNEFNLDLKTVTFQPAAADAARYKFQTGGGSYDGAAATAGTKIANFLDDDARQFTLPFPFPFYGRSYQKIFVNSDGNLTFGEGDTAISGRSLGRVTTGPPRIAPLFRDLDPSRSAQGVRVLTEAGRFVVSWVKVPEFLESGLGPLQTFQARLFPDGKIEFAWSGISTAEAVVAISPGNLLGTTAVVSFIDGSTDEFAGTVAEVFRGGNPEIDIVAAAQKFYQTHEDAYDYLVIFNNEGIPATSGAAAYEVTVRNNREGYGDTQVDDGQEYGSASRLQGVMNMGPLGQYPSDPNARVPGRGMITGDTPMTVIAHEAGHLFLAFASIRDPNDPAARPMLGEQLAHWSFNFNSEASLLEGNRIKDNGAGASPRFTTTATVEGYAPLDQYLMGFRAAGEVPLTFLVTNSNQMATRFPQVGVNISGQRRDVRVDEIAQVEGRRTPDYTVAQRHFRFGFILVAPKGIDPAQVDLDKLETFRSQFEAAYKRYASERATADATLKRSLKLSTFPAAGVVAGGSMQATLTIAQPAATPVAVALETQTGAAGVPASVTIPAGAAQVAFSIAGLSAGVEELTARPADGQYETAEARVQVLSSLTALKLTVDSGNRQAVTPGSPLAEPVVVRLADVNNLPYPGVQVRATVSAGDMVLPATAVTDEKGLAQFIWTTGSGQAHQLQASLAGAPAVMVTAVAVGRPSFAAAGVVNAASYAPGLSPGAFASIFGVSLAGGATAAAVPPYPLELGGVQVLVNGRPSGLHYVSDSQINFVVPPDLTEGEVEIVVSLASGSSAPVRVPLLAAAPGIFYDTVTGYGAIVVAGNRQTTATIPAKHGDFLEIYATGLGATRASSAHPGLQETILAPRVFLGPTMEFPVSFSGLTPGYQGLYQVNVQVPSGAPTGELLLVVEVNGQRSNEVKVRIQ